MVKIVFALFVSALGTAILLDNIGDEEQSKEKATAKRKELEEKYFGEYARGD